MWRTLTGSEGPDPTAANLAQLCAEREKKDDEMFFEYGQNNSGGLWDEDECVGTYVFIEAASAEEANDKAETIGIYFDGADCSCCGDRWSRVENCDDATETLSVPHPTEEGRISPKEYAATDYSDWDSRSVVVHYADGTKKRFAPL